MGNGGTKKSPGSVASPYRGGPAAAPSSTPDPTGLIEQLVHQFADPFAFYRELVQNAIDAGTDSVRVTLSHDKGVAEVSVTDRGSGMTEEVLLDQLLVLFRSGKEGREDAIGKFGVGFVSVLAMNPELVSVTTRCEGRSLRLELYQDQSYELFELGPSSSHGTTVALRVSLEASDVATFAANSVAALRRWCGHALIPITWRMDGEASTKRIDAPLDLPNAVVKTHSSYDDGIGQLVVGFEPDAPSRGFYNRGLLLWSTTTELAGPGISFKVQDPRLEHTLSRDDVCRDVHFDRAMAAVHQVVNRTRHDRTSMPDRIAERASELAQRHNPEAFYGLVEPALALGAIDLQRVSFPLTDRLVEAGNGPPVPYSGPTYVADKPSALTAELAKQGTPVIDLGASENPTTLQAALKRATGKPCLSVDKTLTRVAALKPTASDLVVLDRTASLLRAVARGPFALTFGFFDGAFAPALYAALGRPAALDRATCEVREEGLADHAARALRAALLIDGSTGMAPLFGWRSRPAIGFNLRHPFVAAVRAQASEDPLLSAHFLARALLLSSGRLDHETDVALLQESL